MPMEKFTGDVAYGVGRIDLVVAFGVFPHHRLYIGHNALQRVGGNIHGNVDGEQLFMRPLQDICFCSRSRKAQNVTG